MLVLIIIITIKRYTITCPTLFEIARPVYRAYKGLGLVASSRRESKAARSMGCRDLNARL